MGKLEQRLASRFCCTIPLLRTTVCQSVILNWTHSLEPQVPESQISTLIQRGLPFFAFSQSRIQTPHQYDYLSKHRNFNSLPFEMEWKSQRLQLNDFWPLISEFYGLDFRQRRSLMSFCILGSSWASMPFADEWHLMKIKWPVLQLSVECFMTFLRSLIKRILAFSVAAVVVVVLPLGHL